MTLNWHGVERLAEIEAGLKKNMQKACLLVERDAKINCPVDTGRLRASISNRLEVEESKLVGIVSTNVDYASFVEFGTIHMAAKPYLFPALEANKSNIAELLKE